MKSLVKDFSTTMQGRMIIFIMQVDGDLLYCEIENQPSPAYSSLYLSNFLTFHTLENESFHQRFLNNHQARMIIFGMQIDDDLLYPPPPCFQKGGYTGLHLSFRPSFCLPSQIFRQGFCHNHASYTSHIWYTD